MESSFLELRCKDVINTVDGRNLGHIIDIVFSLDSACIIGIVVPGEQSIWNILKPTDPLLIDWKQITKIGEDSILVEISSIPSPTNYILSRKK